MKPPKRASGQNERVWRKIQSAKLALDHFFGLRKQSVHSFESVLGILLIGTLALFSLLLLPLLFSLVFADNTYVLNRVILCALLIVFLVFLTLLWKKWNYYRLAATMLVWFYGVVAFFGLASWGINTPFAILLVAVVIIMSGILLGSRSTLISAACFLLSLGVLQILIDFEVVQPEPQVLYPSRYGDVVGYGILFFILALISWLYSRQMERSLKVALDAEESLQQEKKLLALELEERTRKLQEAQLAEMQQLYRFAEVGQLSTAMLHDLSNHLTVLTLEIEDIHRQQHSRAIKRAKQTIFYLDNMVDQVRAQLRDSNEIAHFNVKPEITDVSNQLQKKAKGLGVSIDRESIGKEPLVIAGDPMRFRQILTILISNAIDAYKSETSFNGKKIVRVGARRRGAKVELRVRDWGEGISKENQKQLFKPFFTTKEAGMGIGLFIASQILETHFKGSIKVNTQVSEGTEFIVLIPGAGKINGGK